MPYIFKYLGFLTLVIPLAQMTTNSKMVTLKIRKDLLKCHSYVTKKSQSHFNLLTSNNLFRCAFNSRTSLDYVSAFVPLTLYQWFLIWSFVIEKISPAQGPISGLLFLRASCILGNLRLDVALLAVDHTSSLLAAAVLKSSAYIFLSEVERLCRCHICIHYSLQDWYYHFQAYSESQYQI